MAIKTTKTDSTTQIKNFRKQGRLVFGVRQTMQMVREGTVEMVYLASNCPEDVRTEVEHYGELSGIPVKLLKMPSDELGVLCRRQHTILVLGLRKE